MNDPLFIPASFFFFRAPTFSAESCRSYLDSPHWAEELLKRFDQDDRFQEAILVASKTLYEVAQKKPITEPEKIARGLLYYAIRSATRATPFGLFSFVATGQWSNQTIVEFNSSHLIKKTRPDMEWIWVLIKKYYDEKLQNSHLMIRTNPLAQLKGDRITLNYIRYGEKTKSVDQNISIRANELSLTALMCAKEPITLKALCQLIKNHISKLDEEKAEKVIVQMFEQQFFLPAALPSLLDLSLEDLPFEEVKLILNEINEYDRSSLGKGGKAFLNLQDKLKTVAKASSYLQVDLAYNGSPFQLSSKVAEEVSETLQLLWRISAGFIQKTPLVAYHALFLEKYGLHRTVPLLELINDDRGLGSFEKNPLLESKNIESNFETLWVKWLYHRFQECLYKKEREIIIDSAQIDHLLKQSDQLELDYSEAPPSCEVFCKVIAHSQQEIDQGDFDLFISNIFSEGGSSLGRFLGMLDAAAAQDLRAFIEKEESTEPRARFVEMSYWPKESRSANVAIQPCLRKYVLDIEEKEKKPNSFSLEDIYVGATHNRLYLTDKTGEYEIITRVGNLLNYERGPEAFRLLRLITHHRYKTFCSLYWGKEFEQAVYLPRIRHKKTILFPATWKLDGHDFRGKSSQEIFKKFNQWADAWNVPQYPILTQGDNRLLINRHHSAYLKKIAAHLKKGEKVQFVEDLSSTWVKGENGNHNSEIVIPFVKNSIYMRDKITIAPKSFHPISFDQRWQLTGGDWLFFKLYLGAENVDNFLVQHIFAFLRKFDLPWFFVRYKDPSYHLRIRIKIGSHVTFLSEFEKALKFWMETGFINNFMACNYEREIERYGGTDLIDTIEKLFCADALSVIHILQSFSKNKFATPHHILNTLSAIYFLNGFNLSDEQIIHILEKRIKNKKNLQGYREHKALLHALLEKFDKKTDLFAEHACFEQAQVFSQEAKLEFLKSADKLSTVELYDIIDSLLHMHCNRLMGDNREEEKVRHYTYKILIDRANKEKATKRNRAAPVPAGAAGPNVYPNRLKSWETDIG